MTTKTYAITEKQRDEILNALSISDYADDGEHVSATELLQSLTMVSGEPVAIKKHYPNIHMCSMNDGGYRCIEELQPIEPETLLYTSPQLTPITTDDVTNEMLKAYLDALSTNTTYAKVIAAAYNAVIKHRGEAK